jgi:hypothetical protein
MLLPALGTPLNFERSYNSQSQWVGGPMGQGWTHSYNMQMDGTAEIDASLTLTAPLGYG